MDDDLWFVWASGSETAKPCLNQEAGQRLAELEAKHNPGVTYYVGFLKPTLAIRMPADVEVTSIA